MKKLKSLAVAVIALIVFAASFVTISAPAKADETLKQVDVYLLMGQSNAAGFSSVASGNGALTSDTFDNVLVGGVNQPYLNGTVSNFSKLDYASLVPAQKGLGKTSGYFGPEYGMAKALSAAKVSVNGTGKSLYDKDNKAVIFKYAVGASRLLNYVDDTDRDRGTWYPRSLVNTSSATYEEGITGALYTGAVSAFRTFTENLKKSGYQPVVKGIAWMQGEADRDKPNEYRNVIQSFVRDFREDLATITGVSASDAIFAMGEISETFYSSTQRSTNKAFIDMQNEVATLESMQPAAVVETGDLPINLPESELANYGYTKAGATFNTGYGDYTVGTDRAHWNAKDMVLIGERFGAAFLSAYGGLTVKISASVGGSVVADKNYVAEGDSVTFTLVPSTGYKATGFTVNGEDKFAEVKDGKCTVENVTENVTVAATFAQKSEFVIKVEGGKYQINKTSKTVFEGETAYVVPTVPEGKKIKSVTFNGQPMTYNEKTARYEYENVTEAGTIVITYEDATEMPVDDNDKPAEEEKGGCGGKAAAAIASLFALVAAAFVIKK